MEKEQKKAQPRAEALREMLDTIEYPAPNSGADGYIWIPPAVIESGRQALTAPVTEVLTERAEQICRTPGEEFCYSCPVEDGCPVSYSYRSTEQDNYCAARRWSWLIGREGEE